MKKTLSSSLGCLGAALLALCSGSAVASGLVDTSADAFDDAGFTNPDVIDNPWWTLPSGANFLYFTENDDECEWNLVEVLTQTTEDLANAPYFFGVYEGTDARIIRDRAWVDPDCSHGNADGSDQDIRDNFYAVWTNEDVEEETYDWLAQDDEKNIWYMGENTFDGDNWDGSFTAGCDQTWTGEVKDDAARAGIVLLGNPAKGDRHQQEFLEDEAEDWGKVLNFVKMDDMECLKAKEWSPLEPGHIEHKFYCHDGGPPGALLLINELQGKTVVVDLVATGVPSPGAASANINMEPQCPPYSNP